MSAKTEAPRVTLVAITSFVRKLSNGRRATVREGDIFAADSLEVRAHPRAFAPLSATSAELSAAKWALRDAAAAASPPGVPKPYKAPPGQAVVWSGGPRRTAENDNGELPRFPWSSRK